MWTVFIFLHLWALRCTVSSSPPPSPISVVFSSVNLRNTLQWLPGNVNPGDTHFTVQYAIYGDGIEDGKGRRTHWRAVRRCTDITRSWCDLSNETLDLEQGYFARVRAVSGRASSKWTLTKRFDPKSDTTFGAPLVSVEMEDNSAIITLKGPMKYQPNNHTPVVPMATLYPHMMYNLSIHNTRRDQMSHFILVSSTYKHRLMEYDTEYCFSARAKFLSMPIQCQSSAWHCVTTPSDPVIGQLQRMVVGIVVTFVCMSALVVVGYILYHYLTGKGQKSPYILNPPSFNQPILTFPPEKPNIIIITAIKPSDMERDISVPTCPKRQYIPDPPPGYAAQRPGPPPEPEEPWDDVSIDYGFVGVAPKINVRGEAKEREGRHGGDKDGEHQKCESTGTYEMKGLRVDGAHSAGVYATQGKSFLSQRCTLAGAHASWTQADGQIDGGVEEGSERERVPLLSAYASQNVKAVSTSHTVQSDFLPDDYGVLKADRMKSDDDEQQEEGGGTIFIDWDPNTKKIMLPELIKEGGLDGFMQGERGRENGVGGEKKEDAMRGGVALENVYVRQGSEEEAEAQRELGRARERGWDDIFNKWKLVISMDQ